MQRFFIVCLAGFLLVAPMARADEPLRIEASVDARTPLRVDSPNQRLDRLHATALRAEAHLGGGLRAQVAVAHQYAGTRVQQASVEKEWSGGQRVQAGLIRVPFGIYDTRETYNSGLIDYPMPRVDYYLNAVNWGAPGVSATFLTPNLQIEAAAFHGRGIGVWGNYDAIAGQAVRLQTTIGDSVIVGGSRWDGFQNTDFADRIRGNVHVNGIDLRWTRPHWIVRGEVIAGTLGGERTRGAYIDTYYRLPADERVSLVGRIETLKPGRTLAASRQVTLGARWVASPEWTLAVNWRKNNMNRAYAPTWTPYSGPRGAFLFQVFRKLGARP